jgi:hypothetical protein
MIAFIIIILTGTERFDFWTDLVWSPAPLGGCGACGVFLKQLPSPRAASPWVSQRHVLCHWRGGLSEGLGLLLVEMHTWLYSISEGAIIWSMLNYGMQRESGWQMPFCELPELSDSLPLSPCC